MDDLLLAFSLALVIVSLIVVIMAIMMLREIRKTEKEIKESKKRLYQLIIKHSKYKYYYDDKRRGGKNG